MHKRRAILQRLWSIRRSTEQAQDGSYSLKITLDGQSDDGNAWIVRSFPVQPNSTYHVDLSFYLGLLNGNSINTWSVVGMRRDTAAYTKPQNGVCSNQPLAPGTHHSASAALPYNIPSEMFESF